MHRLGDRDFRLPIWYREPVRWMQERRVCPSGEQPHRAPLAYGQRNT